MATRLKKYLCVSSVTSKTAHEDYVLQRVCWKDIGQIKNVSDYDNLLLNLTALQQYVTLQEWNEASELFDADHWADIVAYGGRICVTGDTMCGLRHETDLFRILPLRHVLSVSRDERELDYRRVIQNGRDRYTNNFYRYLDSVLEWKYSISSVNVTDEFVANLKKRERSPDSKFTYGVTSYKTFLSFRQVFVDSEMNEHGDVVLLPPTGRGVDVEDNYILREFFGIATALQEPDWIAECKVPGQIQIETRITETRQAIDALEKTVASEEANLKECKRWFRLLYDDGDSLEEIVQQSFRALGASCEKLSKEKDDFRLKVPGFPDGVMEIKGTRNLKFTIGALRQLGGWMDEVVADANMVVKGVFVGNSERTNHPSQRGKLFEPNCEDFARIKDVVILRSMDLFYLTILNQSKALDLGRFWKEFFSCKASFDVSDYAKAMPPEFGFPSSS